MATEPTPLTAHSSIGTWLDSPEGGPLILYGPWLSADVETAPSNLAFDEQLKSVDPRWGLRRVEAFAGEARARGLSFEETRRMPANNMMLLFRRSED